MSAADDEPIETSLLRMRGRVQGVGFRDGCLRQARALGLAGWVRNRPDGTVETLLQGTPRQIADFRRWLPDGVPAAHVDGVEAVKVENAARCDGFERLPTG